MRSNAERRASRNAAQNAPQPVRATATATTGVSSYEADQADLRAFEQAFGLPRHADSLQAVAPGHNLYLLEGINVEDPKTGAVYGARKGRLLTVIAVDKTPDFEPVFHVAFRGTEQKGGKSDHVLLQRAFPSSCVSVRPIYRGKRGGKEKHKSPARIDADGLRLTGKEAEIG